MAEGEQVQVGAFRVDRPLWPDAPRDRPPAPVRPPRPAARPEGHGGGRPPHPPDDPASARLPRVRAYEPRPTPPARREPRRGAGPTPAPSGPGRNGPPPPDPTDPTDPTDPGTRTDPTGSGPVEPVLDLREHVDPPAGLGAPGSTGAHVIDLRDGPGAPPASHGAPSDHRPLAPPAAAPPARGPADPPVVAVRPVRGHSCGLTPPAPARHPAVPRPATAPAVPARSTAAAAPARLPARPVRDRKRVAPPSPPLTDHVPPASPDAPVAPAPVPDPPVVPVVTVAPVEAVPPAAPVPAEPAVDRGPAPVGPSSRRAGRGRTTRFAGPVAGRRRPSLRRRLRHRLPRNLRAPRTTDPLERRSVVLALVTAVAVVAGVVTFGVRAKVGDADSFAETMSEVHRDRRVAGPMAARLAASLERGASLDPAERADLTREIEDLIVDDDFEDAWRLTLADAHHQASASDEDETAAGAPTRVDDVLPGLRSYLHDRGIDGEVPVEGRRARLLQGDYVAALGSVLGPLGLWSRLLPLIALIAGAAGVLGARNRLRMASALGLSIATVGLATIVATSAAPSSAAALFAPGALQASAEAAARELVPAMRLALLAVVLVGLGVWAACRVEEVASAPTFVVEREDYGPTLDGGSRRLHARRDRATRST